VPAAQFTQPADVPTAAFLYWPAGQTTGVHALEPTTGAWVIAAHAVHDDAPATAYVFARQLVHVKAAATEYLPARQFAHWEPPVVLL